jgi:nitrile hydratase
MHDEHEHDHDGHHHHDDPHAHAPDDPLAPQAARLLERALREMLIDKGVITAAMVQAQIDKMDSRTAAVGARVVARAWTDPAFRAQLTAEPMTAIEQDTGLTLAIVGNPELRVLFNTPEVHNVVVCTLCSCYPRMLLGAPPAWYKAAEYRSRVVREPRVVLGEFGLNIPRQKEVRVHDSTADLRYLVVPERPKGTQDWTVEALAALVTRDCMIGVANPEAAPAG